MTQSPGILYIVATPIGNLADLSERAREVLGRADLVAAEDTRRTGQLLTRLGLRSRMLSLHEHNEEKRLGLIIARLEAGETIALVSDAGTPLISDPGFRLVAAVRERGLPVSAIPGPCAAIAALSIAGLPTDRFRVEGFLPAKSAARRKRLQALAGVAETMVFYEGVHRVVAMLNDLAGTFGPDRNAVVCRELTKLHETVYSGTIHAVLEQLAADPGHDRGEFTVVVAGDAGAQGPAAGELQRVYALLAAELPPGKAAGLAARITGARRAEAYRLASLPADD